MISKQILIALLFFVPVSLFAQEQKVNIAANITVEQAFKQIEKQTTYSIAFNRTKFDVSRRISLSLKNADVGEAMAEILKGTGFTYKINGNHIVIVESKTADNPRNLSVSGYAYDAETGETLIGCSLIDSATNKGTTTNAFGYFSIALPVGTCVLTVRYLGYNTKTIRMDTVRDTTLNIGLVPRQLAIGEVVVQGTRSDTEAKLTKPQMSMMTLNSREIRKMPALLGEVDVMRSIQTLPGIQAANERSTGISVRGGSIDQNLFLLDDAPVFQISHLMGLYSVFNNDAVKDVKIYKGDIPANYGGRLSSVVDVRLRDGNMQKYAVAGGIGLATASLSVEGPIVKDRVSFIVSGKYGYVGWLSQLAGVKMTFYDVNVKVNAVVNSKNRIYFSSYNGADNDGIMMSKYHNNTLSLRWIHVYNPKLFSNVSFIYSNYNLKTDSYTNKPNNSYSWQSGIRQMTLKAEYNYFINNNNTLDFGASFSYNDYIPGRLEGNREAINNAKQPIPFSNRIVEEQGVLDYALYVSNQQKLTDKLSVKYGVRASLYQNLGGHWVYRLDGQHQVADSFYVAKNGTYADYFSIEPRVSINYRLFRNLAVKASYTYTSQQAQLLVKTNGGGPLDIWFPSGVNIRPQTASQFSAGFVQYLFGSALEAGVEGYYKRMDNIIDYKDGANLSGRGVPFSTNKSSYNFEEQLRTGKGHAYGVELMLKGNFWKIDGSMNYTYARSKRKIAGINQDAAYPSPFDKPHTFDMLLNINASKRVSFSANFRLQSGQVTTMPVYVMEMYGKSLMGYTGRNDFRLPGYRRLDLGMTLKGKKNPNRKWQGEWNFSIINVLNHANLSYINFVPRKENPEIIDAQGVYMLGIIPSVAYRFNF